MGSRASSTALVFGATGYTGSAVVKRWAAVNGAAVNSTSGNTASVNNATSGSATGSAVIAHVRPNTKNLAERIAKFEQWGARVEQVPWEDDAIRELVARSAPSVVFSLLGTTRARAKSELTGADQSDPYAAIDERLTLQVLRAVVAAAPGALFIYLSALGVSEGTENRYLLARYHVERALAASGLRYIVARPAFVTGSDRAEFRIGERVIAVAADGILDALALTGVGGLKGLRNKFSSLTGGELARALVSLAQSPPKDREVFPDELRRRTAAG